MKNSFSTRFLALLGAIMLVGTTASATTFTVTNTAGDFTTGSLHWAVERANTSVNPEAGNVVFHPSLNGLTITLDTPLEISRSAGVIIDASDLPGGITVSAATTRILYVKLQNAVVHLRGITFDGGKGKGNPTDGGGAIYSNGTLTATDCTFTNNTSPTAGGAIWNTATGTLMLERCVFANNTAPNAGGAIYNVGTIATMHLCTFSDNAGSNGGAIFNGGSLTATKSVFTGNVGNGPGGGISNNGALTLTQCSITGNMSSGYGGGFYTSTPIGSATIRAVLSRCTLSGNTADAAGGGIHNQLGTTLLDHCTISANTAPVDFASGVGARQSNFTEVIISNSIIAGNTNTDMDDITVGGSSSFTSGGYNIVGSGDGIPAFTHNDQVGVDPLLHPLADNGSLTPTMALQTGSPAIDAATTSANTEDQRGIPVRNSPDIGAFESGSVVVTTTVDEYDTPSGPDVSLREALRDMDFGPSGQPVVLFANALAGQTITLTRGRVSAFGCIIDASPLPGGITISGGNASLVMETGNNSTLNQLTITGGSGTNHGGGGIEAPGGIVTMNDCTITGNTTTGSGGGIYASGAVIYLNRCTISNNTADSFAGGIYLQNADQVTFTRCTITGNSASFGASAIMNNSGGSVTLIHSTISRNIVGVAWVPAINIGSTSALSIENSIVADNGIGDDFGPSNNTPSITVSGKNIVGKNTNVAADFPADGILIGTSAAPVLPHLDPLADNGGLTQTMALQLGSAAIGGAIGSTSPRDQRGVDAVGVADIGAFESSALMVNTTLDELDVPAGPTLSLREALRDAASANATDIVFHRNLSGQTLTLGGTQLLTESDIAIDASGLPEGLIINGNQASRILEVPDTRYLSLRNLTLTGGFVEGHGGAIYNRGRLDLHGVTIHGNTASNSGGAIYHQKVGSLEPSTLTLTRCTISGNSATLGGGIFNQSSALLNHCTVTANTSGYNGGPGIYNHYSSGPSLTINNCIVAGNTSRDFSSADISSDSSYFASLGANLIGDDSGVTGLTGDDIVDPAPLLAPLADNGGPTRTHALLNGSPAINAAIGTADSADQRGFPLSGVADIGAFEADLSNAVLKDLTTSLGDFDEAFPESGWFSIDVLPPIDTATFTPTAADPSSTITVDGSPVPWGTASDPIALTLENQTVTVVVTSHDASTSKTYSIYVRKVVAPLMVSHPSNQTVTAPDSASFSVSATGTAPLGYQWQRSINGGSTWSNLGGASSSSYSTGATTTAMNGYRYRAVVSNSAGNATSNPATLTVERILNPFDYDGDGLADIAYYHTSQNMFQIRNSSTGNLSSFTWGLVPTDIPVGGDYDGDGRADPSVFQLNGTWHLGRTSARYAGLQLGAPGVITVPGDFDGDGSTDMAIYEPWSGTWHMSMTTQGYWGLVWGIPGDIPVPSDYNGDGKTDLAVFRPSTQQWLILYRQTGATQIRQWGLLPTDLPVPGDYDGDGISDLAVYQANGTWHLARTAAGYAGLQLGGPGLVPVPADFDGDGAIDMAVYAEDTGTWHISRTRLGYVGYVHGGPGKVPISLPTYLQKR